MTGLGLCAVIGQPASQLEDHLWQTRPAKETLHGNATYKLVIVEPAYRWCAVNQQEYDRSPFRPSVVTSAATPSCFPNYIVEGHMSTSGLSSTLRDLALTACLVLVASPSSANGNRHDYAPAAFGRGLNTPLASPINHAILPKHIRVKVGGVVDFSVAGFHDIIIFKPGVELDDLVAAGSGQLPSFPPVFVLPPDPAAPLPPDLEFLVDGIYYRGINPAGGPPATPATINPLNSFNRSEPVAFLGKGKYLVICNVRQHLLNGMYAYVRVN